MNIKVVKAFQVGQAVFPTIQEAQRAELVTLFDGLDNGANHGLSQASAEAVLTHTDEVVAILTCQLKSKSLRKPRGDKGKKRGPRKSDPAVT